MTLSCLEHISCESSWPCGSSPTQCLVSQKDSIPNHTRNQLPFKEKDKWHFLRYASKYNAIKHVYTHTSCIAFSLPPSRQITNPQLLTCQSYANIFLSKNSRIPCITSIFFILPGINKRLLHEVTSHINSLNSVYVNEARMV